MSTDVSIFSPPSLTADAIRELAARAADDELLAAARALLKVGPVGFKISSRVPAVLLGRILGRARSSVYTLLCRKLPARWRVPPAPAQQLGFFDDWEPAVEECRRKGPDHQILIMPKNRTYSADVLDVEVGCRPADPTDSRRFELLHSVFAGYTLENLTCPARAAEMLVLREENRIMRRQLADIHAALND